MRSTADRSRPTASRLVTLTIEPRAALAHARYHRLREVDRRMHVDLEQQSPVAHGIVGQGRVDRGRGVVDEHVDRTELVVHRGHDVLTVVGVGQVGDDRETLRARRTNRGERRFERARQLRARLLAVRAGRDRDPGSQLGQANRGGRADTPTRAGDQRDSTDERRQRG